MGDRTVQYLDLGGSLHKLELIKLHAKKVHFSVFEFNFWGYFSGASLFHPCVICPNEDSSKKRNVAILKVTFNIFGCGFQVSKQITSCPDI